MIPEIQLGVHFIVLNFLVNRLPKRQVSIFAKELTECLKLKYKGHWYPKNPDRGTAFRCLEIRDSVFDPVIIQAARASGISLEEIRAQLPDSLFLWMDPYEVCYRIGDQGSLSVLKRFSPETYQYDQQLVSTEDIRLPAQSWEKIHLRKRRNLQSVVHHRRSNYSECSSDSDLDARSRSPDLQDLVNAQPFIPRSIASPVSHYQHHSAMTPPRSHHQQQQFIPVTWTTHPVHPELVAVQ